MALISSAWNWNHLNSILPHNSESKKAGYSAALLSTNHFRFVFFAQAVVIRSTTGSCSRSTDLPASYSLHILTSISSTFFIFICCLLHCVIYLLLHLQLKKNRDPNQFKRLVSMNLLSFNFAARRTFAPSNEPRKGETVDHLNSWRRWLTYYLLIDWWIHPIITQ